MIEPSPRSVGTKTGLFTDPQRDSILARKLSASLGRRFFRGFLSYERDGEHRPEFELTDAIAEQLRLR